MLDIEKEVVVAVHREDGWAYCPRCGEKLVEWDVVAADGDNVDAAISEHHRTEHPEWWAKMGRK